MFKNWFRKDNKIEAAKLASRQIKRISACINKFEKYKKETVKLYGQKIRAALRSEQGKPAKSCDGIADSEYFYGLNSREVDVERFEFNIVDCHVDSSVYFTKQLTRYMDNCDKELRDLYEQRMIYEEVLSLVYFGRRLRPQSSIEDIVRRCSAEQPIHKYQLFK